MKKKVAVYAIMYAVLIALVALIDRLSKIYAYHALIHQWVLEPYVYLQRAMNRGISWGMFSFKNQTLFYLVTALLGCVTLYLIWYAVKRAQQRCAIWGELLVITGSLSNILDRLIYGGVIDFIVITWKDLAWPVFNIADMAIVLGIIFMYFEHAKECQQEPESHV